MTPAKQLLTSNIVVIHFGLQLLGDSLREQGALGCHVDWSPPSTNNQQALDILRKIQTGGGKDDVAKKNRVGQP